METTLQIQGMTCQHCQRAVHDALSQVAGVTEVRVDLENHTAQVVGLADLNQLREAIEEEGFVLLPAAE